MNNVISIEKCFAAVILKNSRKKLVVPIKWVGNLDLLQILNIGLSHTKDHVIFYSKNRSDEPNFAAEVKEHFDEDADEAFCYDGKVLHIWGELFKLQTNNVFICIFKLFESVLISCFVCRYL